MDKEKIVIASDHAGYKLKTELVKFLQKRGFEVLDKGADSEKSADYPDTTAGAASLVSRGEVRRGVVLCGSGIGASIAANKFPKVRAALVYEPEMARLSREHNDANVLVLAGRVTPPAKARRILATWLSTPFSGEDRHKRRVVKIRSLEKKVMALGLFFLCLFLPSLLPGRVLTWEGRDLDTLTKRNCSFRTGPDRIVFRTNSGKVSRSLTNDSAIMIDYDRPADPAAEAELFLDFNDPDPRSDVTGNYRIKSYRVFTAGKAAFRDTPAGSFAMAGDKVVLATGLKSLFNEQTDLESFTVSFWLRTTWLSGRRMILEKGNYARNRFFGLRVFLQSGRMVFRFENMWFDPKSRISTLELQSQAPALSDRWTHYSASYDNTTGKLALFVDGREETIVWATLGGRPESALLVPRFSGSSDLVIGGQPFGDMDDLYVSRSFQPEPLYSAVHAVPAGEVLTGVLENPFFNTEISSVALNRNPSLPGCDVYIRTSSGTFDRFAVKPDWVLFDGPRTGRYFQVKTVLRAGADRASSPVLRSLAVVTKEMTGVEPPAVRSLAATNDLLRVSWDRLFDRRIRGYFVSVRDTATGSVLKLDAGDAAELLVPGLKDRQEYSVTLSSYDDATPFNESRPSREQKILFTFRSPAHE